MDPRKQTELKLKSALGSNTPSSTSNNKNLLSAPKSKKRAISELLNDELGLFDKESSQSVVKKRKSLPTPYHINVQMNKPKPLGQPEVYAFGREALCSAISWYKAYQGSAYTGNGLVYGCLVDKESGSRDVFDHEIIITNIGGGKTASENGTIKRQFHQEKNRYVLAFIQSMNTRQPVGVIAGQGNSVAPAKLPYVYNVLGFFHVTYVWCELEDGLQAWKVRLDKIDCSKPSWWAPRDMIASKVLSSLPKAAELSCVGCQKMSKTIYEQGWACLYPECDRFFDFSRPVSEGDLRYATNFIQERTKYTGVTPPPLSPGFRVDDNTDDVDKDGKYQRGLVCPKCGCCGRRKEWLRFACENPDCDFGFDMPLRSVSISEAMSGGKLNPKLRKPREDIRVEHRVIGKYDVDIYHMPGLSNDEIGVIAHFKANKFINEQPDGPNDIFIDLQHQELNLKRNPAYSKGSILEVLTNHFGANWGAPYKFGVATDSKPFDEAPTTLHNVVQRLTWAGQRTVALCDPEAKFNNFNELLTLAYLQGQKIGYHDDGEDTLGETVVSGSYGSPAKMAWRPKKKPEGASSNLPVLEIYLRHGDMMVMHGAKIQELFVHAVDPTGSLRYGLTCREILIHKLAAEDREYAVKAGTLPAEAVARTYDGDCPKDDVDQLKESS